MATTPAPRPGSPGGPLWDPAAIPAATVVVVRAGHHRPEVLMLRRDSGLAFAAGAWVFPGGRIDPGDRADGASGDRADGASGDLEAAARRAAVREAAEEAGLDLDPTVLRRWSHWTPPPESPRRFSTAFFVAVVEPGHPVRIDGAEIREHRWQPPSEVLDLHAEGAVVLTPPTFITLSQLLEVTSPHQLLHGPDHPDDPDPHVEHFATRVAALDDTIVALYHGDAGYETGDATSPGPRHRLVMGARWTYERTP